MLYLSYIIVFIITAQSSTIPHEYEPLADTAKEGKIPMEEAVDLMNEVSWASAENLIASMNEDLTRKSRNVHPKFYLPHGLVVDGHFGQRREIDEDMCLSPGRSCGDYEDGICRVATCEYGEYKIYEDEFCNGTDCHCCVPAVQEMCLPTGSPCGIDGNGQCKANACTHDEETIDDPICSGANCHCCAKGPSTIAPPATTSPATEPQATTPPATASQATAPPVTAPQSTASPTTAPQAKTPPATAPPASTPPITASPATTPQATAPPATSPPATAPPATTPQATAPPATSPPATAPSATTPPATAPPASTPLATAPPAITPQATTPPATFPPASAQPATTPTAPAPPATAAPSAYLPANGPLATTPPATAPPAPTPTTTAPQATTREATGPTATSPPATALPATTQPTTAPTTSIPPSTAPLATSSPSAYLPVTAQKATTPKATASPATTSSYTVPPAATPPATDLPAKTPPATASPATTVPSVYLLATAHPTTTLSATIPPPTAPPGTPPPVTAPPATTPSATTSPATTPPATTPPATAPPATTPPATPPTATITPATSPPATTLPTTAPPATAAPSAYLPATAPPATTPPPTAPSATTTSATAPLATTPPSTVPSATTPPATAPPATTTPATAPPATTPPATAPPASTPPGTVQPITTLLATAPPATTVPSAYLPNTAPPASAAPSAYLPVIAPPATAPKATALPATTPPATGPPATTPPATAPPATTVPSAYLSATAPPGTTLPDTVPPATTPPATIPPATTPPATAPPATTPPATAPPATTPPGTAPPATTQPPTVPPATVSTSSYLSATVPPSTTPPDTEPPATAPPATASPLTTPPTSATPATAQTAYLPATAPPATSPLATVPPATSPPATAPPATPPPATAPPTSTQPAIVPPATTPPATAPPATAVPSAYLPPTTTQLATATAPTIQPATAPPATTLPATALPATAPPATALPATTLPATAPPASAPPATAPPATAPSATTPPATTLSATAPPATAPPTTYPSATPPVYGSLAPTTLTPPPSTTTTVIISTAEPFIDTLAPISKQASSHRNNSFRQPINGANYGQQSLISGQNVGQNNPWEEPILKNFLVTLETGYGKDAGTISGMKMILVDQNCNEIRHNIIRLPIQDETQCHRVSIPKKFGKLVTLNIALDNRNGSSSDWYCENIFVDDPRSNDRLYFPIDRWIQSNLWYKFQNYATSLPQFEPDPRGRELTLHNKIKRYEFTYHLTAAIVNQLPDEENYYPEYLAMLNNVSSSYRQAQIPLIEAYQSSNNISAFYGGDFYIPESIQFWREDAWFGAQRVQGMVPNIIELCHKIPEKLGVTEACVSGLLEGLTLQQALENNKIFVTDLGILDGIQYKINIDHASPIAVFYLNKRNQLLPIAIQLKQRKCDNNPIYTPKDPPNTWLVAKIYYNNAEAQFQTVVAHLGYTHFIMDGIATSTNRQLSPSHPIFKILKPHFLYLLATNKLGIARLLIPGGSFDRFSLGLNGTKDLLAKAIPEFTFRRAIGSVESDARARGVWDKQVLPYYPFRDDANSMYNIIKTYVTTIMTSYYDTPGKITDDWELQRWRAELARPRAHGGVGIPDLPGSNTAGFAHIDEIIDLVTMIITHSSVGHAAVNFGTYDTYGYFPNYPTDIIEGPPLQKQTYTESEIMRLFPDLRHQAAIRASAKFLSWHGTNDLGDFERTYLYDPVSQKAQMELTNDLNEFSKEVKKRNRNRFIPYKYLDPNFVPNASSI